MIKHSFYIKEERLNECKEYIRSISSARFIHNPLKINDEYNIYVSFDNTDDANKMNILFNKWDEQDNPKIEKKNFWETIKNCLIK